jgi:DNA polymerase I-like protein with 3'-5' exonuclease and polymerase domains
LGSDGRIHTTYTNAPSTLRQSTVDPNVQNLISDNREDKKGYAKRFRRCLVAAPGNVLIEADFNAIEAVQVGYFAADPFYIRMAKLGIHAYLTAIKLGRPADPKWSDLDLKDYLTQIKEENQKLYFTMKCICHGSAYGETPRGLMYNHPGTFRSLNEAAELQRLFFQVAPKVRAWQTATIERAHKEKKLGGYDHPFRYLHWFWNVQNYRPIRSEYDAPRGSRIVSINRRMFAITLGEDAKRALAFYPQSTTGGIIKETALGLLDPESENYVGDSYLGGSPLRALIHDSILLEVEKAKLDHALERVYKQMTGPIKQQPLDPSWGMGEHLTIGVTIKVGSDWGSMEKVKL